MALQDKIGREEIVDKICGLVGSLKKDKNFCLAINGAWGSGKTFVLDMIEEKLSERQEYIVIKYDAWENNFYPDPLIAILSCVIDGIDEKLYLLDRKKERAMKAAKSGVNTLAKVSAKIEKLQTVIEGIKNIIKIFHNPIDTAVLGDFKSYKTLLKETKDILNEITQVGEYREKQTKLIILVDEIDRCLPDEQLKILERLHHLFDVKNCTVIVAMNQICVVKTIQTIYGVDGYEYLRKFFDFTFNLETSASEYLLNLLRNFADSLNVTNNIIDKPKIKKSIYAAYVCSLYGEKSELKNIDNREITRYFRCLQNICNDFGWGKLNANYIFFILIALYCRRIKSHTFLNYNEIIQKQNIKFKQLENVNYSREQIYYYDYMEELLGVDRARLADELQHENISCDYMIPELIYYFNAIIFLSVETDFHLNWILRKQIEKGSELSRNDCKELRRLVILYGGEQEKCEK